MITVKELIQTCGACPSQWEGMTDDGKHIYVRYRWGNLEIGIGDTEHDAVVQRGNVFDASLSDGLDGVLGYDELIQATGHLIRWPQLSHASEL